MESVPVLPIASSLRHLSLGEPLPSPATADSARPNIFKRAKFAVAGFVRKTLHAQRPEHKRLSTTGASGFIYPQDISTPRLTADTTVTRPSTAPGATPSIRLNTPDIFLTLPTVHGRMSYRVHQGSICSNELESTALSEKCVRVSHPSATAIIPALSARHSADTLRSTATATSIPKTIDMMSEFPGEVNVRRIARDALLNYEDAKAVVDGTKSRETATPLVSAGTSAPAVYRSFALPDWTSDRVYKAYSRDAGVGDDGRSVQVNRDEALAAIEGVTEMTRVDAIPASLLPGSATANRPSTATAVLAANGGTFLKDRLSYSSQTSQAGFSAQLQYIPYSRFIDRETTPPPTAVKEEPTTPGPRGVKLSFDEFDDALLSFSCINDNKGRVVSASVIPAATPNAVVPRRLSIIDNGYPVMHASNGSWSVPMQYTARTLIDDEKKLKQAEERRRAKRESKANGRGTSLFGFRRGGAAA